MRPIPVCPRLVQDKPEVTRDPETIIAQAPDVVVTSPFFTEDGIEALTRVGIPVVQTELQHDPEARINSILFMGYIFGEEQRAFEFAAEVRERFDALVSVTSPATPKPRVLAVTHYSDTLWVAGGNSTEGGVIVAAGGINAAEDAGIESNQPTSLEGIIAMAPEVIVIPQPVGVWRRGVSREPASQRGPRRGSGHQERPCLRGREQALHDALILEHPWRRGSGPPALARRLPQPTRDHIQPCGVSNDGKRQATGNWRAGRLLSD